MGEHSKSMKCEVVALEYDFVARTGRLYLAPDNCCDMAGCIRVFKAIDPGVRRINVFAGDKPDVWYGCPLGDWQAFEPQTVSRAERKLADPLSDFNVN